MLSNKERWELWMLLEHGPLTLVSLEAIWQEYEQNRERFSSDKLYFGCGHEASRAKYSGWDLCDIREIDGVILWDVLMGLPYEDEGLTCVKSKLSLGMFTTDQVDFLLYETARCLKVGGVLELGFRDFDKLLARRDELDNKLFVRYIYGSGLYYGSRRRSCWSKDTLAARASLYGFSEVEATSRGMNSHVKFRLERKTRKGFTEPKVLFKDNGEILNDGGEFDRMSK